MLTGNYWLARAMYIIWQVKGGIQYQLHTDVYYLSYKNGRLFKMGIASNGGISSQATS